MAIGSARNPVMADVARRAGVSHQTVSRVLNDLPNVRPTTRDRVLAAIHELGYQRNLSARALVTRTTNTLGVVAVDTTLFGPASTLFGVERAAREAGYFVSIVSVQTITRASVSTAIRYLSEQAVDGIVVIAPHRQVIDVDDLPRRIPVVAVEGGADEPAPVVAVDQHAGAVLATRHLVDLGHPTVWHVAGPPDWVEAVDRRRGWRDALEAAGAPVPDVVEGDWSPRSGYEAGRLIADRSDIGAVFVANDQMALGVLRALHEAGRTVPDDVSVVGFDDVPEAAYYLPPLTTVRQDFAAVGRRAIGLVLDMIGGGEIAPARIVIAPELVVRNSTQAALHRTG